MWGESKLAKMACSCSLTPHFVNNDYVTAEIIYRTAHAHHKKLASSPATLCCGTMWTPPKKRQHYYCISALSVGSTTRGDNVACLLLWLLHQPGENKHVFSSYGSSGIFPASLLVHCLPWVQRTVSTDRYNKTIGIRNRISDTWTFVSKVMSLLFNMLSRFVIAFLPRSKHLLISWPKSPPAMILKSKKIKSVTVSTFSPSICHEVMGLDAMILVFWRLSFKSAFSFSSFTLIKRFCSSTSLSATTGYHLRIWGCWYFSHNMNQYALTSWQNWSLWSQSKKALVP